MIPLARPYLTPKARRNIERCFDENFFSQGFFNVQFEKEFAEYVGMDYATTCSNGTAALWLALKAAGVGPGDEVIVPTLTFTGSVGPIASVGARPVFVDSNPEDGNISPAAVAAALTPHTKAVIAVDLYGISADYAGLRKVLAKRNDIVLIEDAAEGLGGTHQGKPIGHAGDISCFSFFGNKILTTGEGGMCTTNNQKFHDAMVLYKNHGIGDRHYWVEVAHDKPPGRNWRFSARSAPRTTCCPIRNF
jgi:perosamine synthetase